jgi:hypothetical protein
MVSGVFDELVPAHKYTFRAMRSGAQRYNADRVLAAIRDMRVGGSDTFAFLYHGHGAHSSRGHFMHMPDGDRLYSNDVKNAIERKRCRLRIILTDSCNRSIEVGAGAAQKGEPWSSKRDGVAPVMEELFFNHRGLLHINSAYTGQYSFSEGGGMGSIFFTELFGYCVTCPTGRPLWKSIDDRLTRILDERFRQDPGFAPYWDEQKHWYPIRWSTPRYIWSRNDPRFGATAEESGNARGLQITEVQRNHPAGTVLRVGDRLISINGNDVDSEAAYIEFVSCSPRTMRLTFLRNGALRSAEVRLSW